MHCYLKRSYAKLLNVSRQILDTMSTNRELP